MAKIYLLRSRAELVGESGTLASFFVPKPPVFAYYSNFILDGRSGELLYEVVMEISVSGFITMTEISFVAAAGDGVMFKSTLDTRLTTYDHVLLPLTVGFCENFGSDFSFSVLDGSD